MRTRPVVVVFLLWLALVALSTLHQTSVMRVRPEVMGCETGCRIVARGWPAAFVVDGASSSPVNSADLVGLAIGVDDLDVRGLAKTAAFWLVFSVLLAGLIRPKARRLAA